MTEVWQEPWFPWAVGLAVGVPVLLIVLTEVLGALSRRGNAAAKPVRLLRNFVVPVGAVFALLVFATARADDITWVRIVGTLLGFLLILLILSAFNVALFANAEEGSWRDRIPSIFVDLARLALILIGLAILFSWVWGADIGGLVTALGVTSIVIGLALQNAVGGVISGLLLLFEQPFRLGDWLDTGSVRGRVVEVNWRAVHLDTGNGIQIVPNSSLAGASFTNLSQPVGAFTASVEVTFSTDDAPDDVLRLLREVASALPMLEPSDEVSASYLGAARFSVTLPVTGPSAADEAVARFRAWLWYAARRRGLALDGDGTDPIATPERLGAALVTLAPTLHAREEDLDELAGSCTLERYGPGETVQAAGTVPDAIRFLIEGGVQLAVPTKDGLITFQYLGTGDVIGQTALTREVAMAAAIADGTTLVLRMPLSSIDRLVRTRPRLAQEIGASIDHKHRQAQAALAEAGIVRGTIGR
ncbi:mechanosensitive ion channel domain-containing protein [Plantibacter sp. LMC-P-059a]|uniref:mechanosensitive ion channel domain-containing protein n=1 Tax=Plantibacter sp. LMC-P-059a TaxID=3040297 RepID=UPI00254EC624|nr:mechanosensitive ion channel domain-containing protein [Plantibacter sp. LMC-P-059a]